MFSPIDSLFDYAVISFELHMRCSYNVNVFNPFSSIFQSSIQLLQPVTDILRNVVTVFL